MAYGGISECAPNLDDGELWLPSGFLHDMAEKKIKEQNFGAVGEEQFPFEWGCAGDSNSGSPVESGVSETEDEDDYMAFLAQRVAYAMLDDDDDETCAQNVLGANWAPEQRVFVEQAHRKGSSMARSPQSTLSGFERLSIGSSRRFAPTCNAGSWEFDNMAADQEVRLNLVGCEHGTVREDNAYQTNVMYFPGYAAGEMRVQFAASPVEVNQNNVDASRREFEHAGAQLSGVDSAFIGTQQGREWAWKPRPAKAEVHKIGAQPMKPYADVVANGRTSRATAQAQSRCVSNRLLKRATSPFPPGYMVGGSGMRAVFLGSNGPGRESGGTGVFLPRRMDSNGYTAKQQQKPACSTVLLPARIVQALNLNVDDLRSHPCVYARRNDKQQRRSVGGDSWTQQQQQQKTVFCPGCYDSQLPSSDISLPQEWTY